MRILLLGLLLATYAQSASAGGLDLECSGYRPLLANDETKRPEPPSCASYGFQFSGEYDFDSCKSEMEEYRRKIAGYGRCLASEQEQAIEQFNETVESFNRKASN
ncbi:hypothetical protein [Mesorhizobium sp. WSM3866]|uniref:hypothetical protein n=2 Tax=unclassified Mesorhizobium TaxID=325217 RepID=UPI001140DADC|nr:hypothetical protein [Mesorhizobium sp. WSM3866]